MEIRVGDHVFERADWYADGDVLYLSKRDQAAILPDGWHVGPEGHAVVYDERGCLVRVTLVNPRALLERHGRVPVTDDDGKFIGDADVAALIGAPAAA